MNTPLSEWQLLLVSNKLPFSLPPHIEASFLVFDGQTPLARVTSINLLPNNARLLRLWEIVDLVEERMLYEGKLCLPISTWESTKCWFFLKVEQFI